MTALQLRRLAVLALALGCTGTAWAEDAYVVGLSAAVTGPGSGTYAPVQEAIALYFNQVNARGGVNGKPVRILVEDNQASPQRAAADAKKFVTQDNVLLLMNASLSSTYAPMVAEAQQSKTPLFFAGAVCPPEVYPKADPLLFCSTAFGARFDSRFALGFIKSVAKQPVKLGLVSMSIPVSRGEVDFAEKEAPSFGITPVDNESIPPPTANYAPFATKLLGANPNWVYSWAPWVTQVKTLEALRAAGWTGAYIAFAHINAEDELLRLKDDKFYVFGANAFFQDDTATHRAIKAAAEKQKTAYPATQLTEGWIAAQVLEAALKQSGWPTSRARVLGAMDQVQADLGGLRGGPLAWTPQNHFRTAQSYRVYRWDGVKNAVVLAKDWTTLEVK